MKKSMPLTLAAAKKIYATCPADVQQELQEHFGDELFRENIMDQVKNFDDVLRISGKAIDQVVSPDDEPHVAAYKKLCLVAEVYRQGVVLNPADDDQYKYYPWFEVVKDKSKPSGFGLSCLDYGVWTSHSDVGSRLCVDTSEKAIDMGKKFIAEYEEYLVR